MPDFNACTVADVIDHYSRMFPEKQVFVCGEEAITYGQLKEKTSALARGLSRIGVRHGDKIAIWAPNSIDWILVQLATATLGAVLVPINTRHRRTELAYTLNQSDAGVLFLAKEFGANFLDIFREICPEIEDSPPGDLRSKAFPLLTRVVSIGGWRHPGMLPFEDLPSSEAGPPRVPSRPEDVVLIQYTSGTTGPPKGAMLSQGQTIRDAYQASKRMELTSDDVILCCVPFGHVGGTVLSTLLTLVVGARMIIQPLFREEETMELIQKHRCTVFNGLETFFISFYNHPRFGEFDLSTLRCGWAAGQPEIFHNIIKKIGMKKICNVFGMSETSPNACMSLPSDPPEVRASTSGKPHEGLEVRINDVDTSESMPPGGVGEICVRGWAVMQGYYKMPEETRKAIDADGWLHTGDLGVLNEDGYLTFKGRFKDLLRVGGENVSPWEVESFILTHPQVQQVSVIGIKDERLMEVCAAVVKLKKGASCAPEEIIAYCRGNLASFKIPKKVILVDEFPMTESGKVQKFKLLEIVQQDAGRA